MNLILNFLKDNFKFLFVFGALILFYFQGCFDRFGPQKPTSDTTHQVIQVPQPVVIMPEYKPQQSGSTVYIPIPASAQGVIPASTVDSLISQVKDLNLRIEALGKQYYAIKTYKDSIELKDTAGTKVGIVDLTQVVSENELKSTQPSYKLNFPHTITTITNTIPYKPRNQLYIGAGVSTSPNAAKLGILMKNKRDVAIGISGVYGFDQKKFGAEISLYKLITLKKN